MVLPRNKVGEALDVEPFRVAQLAEQFVAGRDEHGAQHRAADRAHAAHDQHDEDENAGVERELLGVHTAQRLCPQRTPQRDEAHAEHPSGVARREQPDAQRRGGQLVFTGGDAEPADACLLEQVSDDQRDERARPQPTVALQARDARQATRATGELLPVLHDLVDDEQTGQGDHGGCQPAGAAHRHPEERACHHGDRDREQRGADRPEVNRLQAERNVGQ